MIDGINVKGGAALCVRGASLFFTCCSFNVVKKYQSGDNRSDVEILAFSMFLD